MWCQNGAELVKKIKAVYCIKVLLGDKVGTWVIDVKNNNGSVRYDPQGTLTCITIRLYFTISSGSSVQFSQIASKMVCSANKRSDILGTTYEM